MRGTVWPHGAAHGALVSQVFLDGVLPVLATVMSGMTEEAEAEADGKPFVKFPATVREAVLGSEESFKHATKDGDL